MEQLLFAKQYFGRGESALKFTGLMVGQRRRLVVSLSLFAADINGLLVLTSPHDSAGGVLCMSSLATRYLCRSMLNCGN